VTDINSVSCNKIVKITENNKAVFNTSSTIYISLSNSDIIEVIIMYLNIHLRNGTCLHMLKWRKVAKPQTYKERKYST